MTNLDKIKTAKNGYEFVQMYEYFNYGCIQIGTREEQEYIAKNHCNEYRGENGCKRCKMDFGI